MSTADVVIIAALAFFLVGVMVGIAVVAALPARKAGRVRYLNRSEAARDANRHGKSNLPV
jgi:chloramphenicol 3-O-phosphotransferase